MEKKAEKIGIGIIGCGRISDLHVRGYASFPEAEIRAVCDADKETARRRKDEWGASACYTDYRELLADDGVDAVDILTPHLLHEEMALSSLAAGKHTAVQKPMTVDMASTKRMIAAAEKSNRVFKVTENYVFYPPIVKARELIDSGAIGEPQNIRIHLLAAGSGGWKIPNEAWAWRMKEFVEGRGMQTFDHGHHLWSTAWFLLGSFEEVTAWIDNINGLVDSPAVMMWKHRKPGRYGTCSFSYSGDMILPSDYYANDEWIEVSGSSGVLRIHRCTGRLVTGAVISLYNRQGWQYIDDVPCDWQLGFTGAMQNFLLAIRGEASPALSAAEAGEIMAMDLAVQKSARLQRSVYLDEMTETRPEILARKKRRHKIKALGDFRKGMLNESRTEKGQDTLAGQAEKLTLALKEKIDMSGLNEWKAVLGLDLTGEGVGSGRYTFSFDKGTLRIDRGTLPENCDLLITVRPEIWAALLLKKRKMQTAFLQGKLKLKGDLDYAFKLKDALGL
ncbi:MAG: Gfo/Idh/MocA family oxidoreductase [Spirochaetales bacterium]|nr:Gfo/Idh/MocA family oxidoreductase [Spirochaetales bacterium]